MRAPVKLDAVRADRIVVLADGTESQQSADTARPGDILEYVASYQNSSSHVIRQLAATLPIPDGTEFVASSTLPAGALASTATQCVTPLPASIAACNVTTQPSAGGQGALKWTLTGSLQSGASGSVLFLVTLQ
jgi:uncharacterized repeat protein (TIGR01451 family)